MSEHQAWIKIEEWSAKTDVRLENNPFVMRLRVWHHGQPCEIESKEGMDVRLIDCVTRMVALLAYQQSPEVAA